MSDGEMKNVHNGETLEWALRYATLGWKIFPLHTIVDGECTCGTTRCPDAGKHPRNVRGVKEATDDKAQIVAWFNEFAQPSNIGIRTGEVSGITVIDIDIGPGKFGAESWAEIVSEHGEPETLTSQTGSGGVHLVFAYNSTLKTASNVLGKGIDSRNDGGYIVAAPSKHRSGGVYKWENWGSRIVPLPAHLATRKENRGRPAKDDMYRSKYTIEQVKQMLDFIDPGDRDLWRNIGVILGREFNRVDEAWDLYNEWADKWGGKKGRNHDEIMHEAFYKISEERGDKSLSIGTLVKAAIDGGWVPKTGEVPIGHFVFYGPGNNYIYRPTTSFWIASAVDAAVSPVNELGKIIRASEWLRLNQLCTSMTSHPDIEDDMTKGFDCRFGEVVPVPGAAMFNAYRRPTIELGDPRLAGPFLDHVRSVFDKPGDADQFLDYMAHRVQKPGEKPRFALLLAGEQGVGKDTAVEFCVPAIGSWNVSNIDPNALDGAFNEYAASTLVRINEAANLHEMTKWAFNEQTKVLIAGTPDEVTINPKYGQKYSVKMFCGVIITTNHLSSGIYIPEGDRRYDVISAATVKEMCEKLHLKDEFELKSHFSDLWAWFFDGGRNHIAAYLHERDISKFSAGAGQRKTEAHKTVVAVGKQTDSWLIDALDAIEEVHGQSDVVRGDWVVHMATKDGENKPKEINAKMSAAMQRAGYSVYKNQASSDGRFKFGKKKTMVYRRTETGEVDLSLLDREAF